MDTLVKAGGFYCITLVVFHLLFWKIFNWKNELRKLNSLNQAIMQVLNLSLTVVFVMFSYISIAHTDELLSTPLGHTFLGSITFIWLFRSVLQVVFFKLEHWGSWAFLVFFLSGAVIYGLPFAYHT